MLKKCGSSQPPVNSKKTPSKLCFSKKALVCKKKLRQVLGKLQQFFETGKFLENKTFRALILFNDFEFANQKDLNS